MSFGDMIARARGSMVMDKPFFATLAFKLGIQQLPPQQRPVTDGVIMGFDPAYIEGLRPEQVKGVVAALSIACGLGHPFRMNGRNQKLWSYASNCITGHAAQQAGFEMPDDWPLDHRFTVDIPIEEAYRILEAEQQQQQQQQQQQGGQQGQGQGQGQGQPQGRPQGQGQGQGQQGGKNGQPSGGGADINKPKGGGGGGGGDEEGPEGPDGGDGGGDQEGPTGPGGGSGERDGQSQSDGDGQPLSPDKLRQMEHDWQIRMVQAGNVAKSMGSVPGWMKSILDEINAPQVDWRAVLRRFLQDSTRDDYSFLRPSRRYSGDVIFPGLYSEGIPHIVVALDTSRSVSNPERKQFLGELNSMLEEFDMEVTVLFCDSRINLVKTYGREDLPIMDQAGYGGTDFRPPFQWVEREMERQPNALIYCSDMECNSFPHEPSYPVLWVSTAKEEHVIHCTGGGVPFGELLFVTVDGRGR